MNLAKNIFGWVLLILGVVIIGWSLFSSYNVFAGKIAPPRVFDSNNAEIFNNKKAAQTEDAQAQVEKIVGEQLKDMMPPDALPKIFNLGAWSILASIFIFGGAQISGLGIRLPNKQ